MGYLAVPLRGNLYPRQDQDTARLAETLQLDHVGGGVVIDYRDDAKAASPQVIKQLGRCPESIAVDGMQVQVQDGIGRNRRLGVVGLHDVLAVSALWYR